MANIETPGNFQAQTPSTSSTFSDFASMPHSFTTTTATTLTTGGTPTKEDMAYFPPQKPFESHPHVKVIIVGAGLGGIITAILLSHKVPNLSYTIFERNCSVGGTWASNIYPGVRCDVPSHCYKTTFAPNPEWSEYYSQGEEIRAYYEKLADEYGVMSNIRLRQEITRAFWSPAKSAWQVEVRDLETQTVSTETAQFFVNAQGRLSEPKFPDIPGLTNKFAGKFVHTAAWDPNLELAGKRVAIIGNGASGQQILPTLLPKVSHIDHYARSRVWVSPTFQKSLVQATADHPGGYKYTVEDKKRFREDPAHYLEYRRGIEVLLHDKFQRTIIGSKDNEELRQACIQTMSQRVGHRKEWLDKLVPDFAPGCQRLTPGPGYLEALQHPKVDFIQTGIREATEQGITTTDGNTHKVDIIIAATGFRNGFVPYFPTIGLDGVDISKEWANEGAVGYPETYFGIMAPEMPNYFFILQAQSNGGGGSIPLQVEISATYIAKVIRKLQREGYSSITPSRQAVRDFNDLCYGYFQDKVVNDTCSSWLKSNGPKPRNLVWWPGSGHHRFDICRDPRWEDFDYGRSGEAEANRYAYFGSGWTEREKSGDKDRVTKYLKKVNEVDLALLHEYWNE